MNDDVIYTVTYKHTPFVYYKDSDGFIWRVYDILITYAEDPKPERDNMMQVFNKETGHWDTGFRDTDGLSRLSREEYMKEMAAYLL